MARNESRFTSPLIDIDILYSTAASIAGILAQSDSLVPYRRQRQGLGDRGRRPASVTDSDGYYSPC